MKNKLNQFNLSHGNGLSLRIGELVPIYVEHLVPGDRFNIDTFLAARFAPMMAPIMTNIDIKTWAFAVPYRLIWDDYKEFFTGKNKKGDDVDPTFPRINYGGLIDSYEQDCEEVAQQICCGTLSDYLDLPHIPIKANQDGWDDSVRSIPNLPDCSVLEPRAYQLIYNEWIRDQNIDDPVEFGTDSYIYDFQSTRAKEEWSSLMRIRKLRWSKDYFTSALPTPSLSPDVAIPIDSQVNYVNPDGDAGYLRSLDGKNIATDDGLYSVNASVHSDRKTATLTYGQYEQHHVAYDPNTTLRANDNDTTIRELTYSKMVYQYLLDISRGGSVRYKDFVKTLFGVTLPDYRAEIPEYIGGGFQPVIVSEVLQTSETNETPQGNISGRAVSIGRKHHAYYQAKEHCLIMILACAMPRPSYMSGLPKRHFKFDRFDYYIPQFDHVGDQPILRKELDYSDTIAIGEETFGYTPRYSEYKSAVDRVHGELRNTLSYWTMARDFRGRTPVLSPEFLVPERELIERPFFVQTDGRYSPEQVYLECSFNVKAFRPMSKMSTPIV